MSLSGSETICDGDTFAVTILATRLIERGDVVRTTSIIKLTRAKALWLSSTVVRSITTHPDGWTVLLSMNLSTKCSVTGYLATKDRVYCLLKYQRKSSRLRVLSNVMQVTLIIWKKDTTIFFQCIRNSYHKPAINCIQFRTLMMFGVINIPCNLSRCSGLITLNIINTYDGIFPEQWNSFTYSTVG